MRKFALALLLCSPLLTGCAGGGSRYGCPAEPGYSCQSVSEVYAGEASGRKSGTETFPETPRDGKNAGGAAREKLPKGAIFRPGKNGRSRGEGDAREAAPSAEAMPVYVPPPVIRLRIAPWQDARGVFHSEKYVYLVSGGGRWTIGGKTVTLGEPGGEHPGSVRLRGTGRTP